MQIKENYNILYYYTKFLFSSGVSHDVKAALVDLESDESAYVPQRPATELFRMDSGVQIFFVAKDGRVSREETVAEGARLFISMSIVSGQHLL